VFRFDGELLLKNERNNGFPAKFLPVISSKQHFYSILYFYLGNDSS